MGASIGAVGARSAQADSSHNNNPVKLRAFIKAKLTRNYVSLYEGGMDTLCPNFDKLPSDTQSTVVATLITAVAGAESGYNSFDKYWEKDMKLWSVGLFQMSKVDAKNYGCKFEESIYDNGDQLNCFVRATTVMLAHPDKFKYVVNLAKDSSRAKGDPDKLTAPQKLSAYWSIFRTKNKTGGARFKAQFNSLKPEACSTK